MGKCGTAWLLRGRSDVYYFTKSKKTKAHTDLKGDSGVEQLYVTSDVN